MKVLGAKAFSYGYASPVLMAATYNDDGTVNVINLHEVARTNAGDLVCCIGKPKKTHENIEKRKAFTLTLANESLMKEIDYLGTVSGYKVPDKFEKTVFVILQVVSIRHFSITTCRKVLLFLPTFL